MIGPLLLTRSDQIVLSEGLVILRHPLQRVGGIRPLIVSNTLRDPQEALLVQESIATEHEEEALLILPQQHLISVRYIVVCGGVSHLDVLPGHLCIYYIIEVGGDLIVPGRVTSKGQMALSVRPTVFPCVGIHVLERPALRQPGDAPAGGQGVGLGRLAGGIGHQVSADLPQPVQHRRPNRGTHRHQGTQRHGGGQQDAGRCPQGLGPQGPQLFLPPAKGVCQQPRPPAEVLG